MPRRAAGARGRRQVDILRSVPLPIRRRRRGAVQRIVRRNREGMGRGGGGLVLRRHAIVAVRVRAARLGRRDGVVPRSRPGGGEDVQRFRGRFDRGVEDADRIGKRRSTAAGGRHRRGGGRGGGGRRRRPRSRRRIVGSRVHPPRRPLGVRRDVDRLRAGAGRPRARGVVRGRRRHMRVPRGGAEGARFGRSVVVGRAGIRGGGIGGRGARRRRQLREVASRGRDVPGVVRGRRRGEALEVSSEIGCVGLCVCVGGGGAVVRKVPMGRGGLED